MGQGPLMVVLAAVIWGVGRFLAELAVTSVSPWLTSLVRSLVFFPIVAGYVWRRTDVAWSLDRPTVYGAAAGVCVGVAIVSARLALSVYEVSLVSPIQRLNVVVTLAFALVLLEETLTVRKALGVVTAIGAAVLLAP